MVTSDSLFHFLESSGSSAEDQDSDESDNEGIKILESLRKECSYDTSKKYCCPYCEKMGSKLSRHLATVHKNEPEVKAILDQTIKGSAERRTKWIALSKKGAYKHNLKTIQGKKGILLVRKQPSKGKITTLGNYRACPECYGFYTKRTIRAHLKTCTTEIFSVSELKIFFNNLAEPSDPEQSKIHLVTSTMAEDEITTIVKEDPLILKHGANIFEGFHFKKHREVSYRMRLLGRLIKELRGSTNNATMKMADVINPRMFDLVLKSVKEISGIGAGIDINSASIPSTALKLGHELKHVTHIFINSAIRTDDCALEKRGENFKKLHEREWGSVISKHSLLALDRKKKTEMIPFTSDIQVSVCYIKNLASVEFYLCTTSFTNFRKCADT